MFETKKQIMQIIKRSKSANNKSHKIYFEQQIILLSKSKWRAYTFSSMFILDVATKSQKDHKLFSATYTLCS